MTVWFRFSSIVKGHLALETFSTFSYTRAEQWGSQLLKLVGGGLNGQNTAHPHGGLVSSNKKEGISDTCNAVG